MSIFNRFFRIFIFILVLISVLSFYFYHHFKVLEEKELKFYNSMIFSLYNDDACSSKYYMKKILKIERSSIYSDITFLLLYNIKKREKNIDFNIFKNKFLKNKRSLFKNL